MNQTLDLEIAGVMPLAVATGLFVSLCSISAPTPASGAISGTYAPVSGLQSIVCMDAPDDFGVRISASEMKDAAETASMARRHVLLDAYYDALSPESNWGEIGWRATVVNTLTGSSVDYDIMGVEADSQHTQTRLCVRKVTT